MFATSALVLALATTVAYAQAPSVQTPSLVQCANSVINFSGGSGPYYVAVLQGQDPCNNDAIQEFFNVNDNSVSYTPVLSSGSQVVVYVEDANGQEAWSDSITLGDGDSSCLGVPTPSQDSSGNTPTDVPTTYNTTYNTTDNTTDNTADNATDNTTDDTTTDDCTTDDNTTTDNYTTDNYATEDNTPEDNTPEDNTPEDNTPEDNTPEDNTPEDNATDDSTTDDNTTETNTTNDGADTLDQSPTDDSTTGTTYAPYSPAAPSSSASTDTGATVQSTNKDKNNQGTTPANANGNSGATGLAVSAFATLCAALVVSFGLF